MNCCKDNIREHGGAPRAVGGGGYRMRFRKAANLKALDPEGSCSVEPEAASSPCSLAGICNPVPRH